MNLNDYLCVFGTPALLILVIVYVAITKERPSNSENAKISSELKKFEDLDN